MMYRAPSSVITLDLYEPIMTFSHKVKRYCSYDSNQLAELVRAVSMITYDIIDDIVSENLFWTKPTTISEPDRYTGRLRIREGTYDEVWEHMEDHIVALEGIIDSQSILPSWSFFDITQKSTFIIIHMHGDYRVEDWMKRHGRKVKVTRLPRGR